MEMCWQSMTALSLFCWAHITRTRIHSLIQWQPNQKSQRELQNCGNQRVFPPLLMWCGAVWLLIHNLCQLWFCILYACVFVFISYLCVFRIISVYLSICTKNVGQCEKLCTPLICRYDNASHNLGAFYRWMAERQTGEAYREKEKEINLQCDKNGK